MSLFRTMFYLPVVAPMVAVSLSWMWLYDKNIGFLNYVLGLLNVSPLPWLTSAKWAMKSVIIMSIWKSMGYNMVIFLAGLQGIPVELYEAAQTDGATGWRNFWSITLPLLKPTTLLVSVMVMLQCLKTFSTQYLFSTSGAPTRPIDVITLSIYNTAIKDHNIGRASAMSVLLFLVMLILTWLQLKIARTEDVTYN